MSGIMGAEPCTISIFGLVLDSGQTLALYDKNMSGASTDDKE